jgi:CMP-N-acetylneuraminic acid synthetase
MYKNKTILAIILARGGSKGIPRKNIRPLLKKPLIAWTIEQAKNSRCIDRVIVSTDDSQIAAISKRYDAEIPFIRPKKLARDDSPSSEPILHAMDFFEKKKESHDILLSLECTSPMRYKGDIDNIIRKLIDTKNSGSVVGVVQSTNDHPLWTFKLQEGHLVKFVSKTGIQGLSRQSLEKAYLPYSVYATRWENYKKYKTFYQPNTLPYFLKREQKVDIDDEVDFYLAECILKKHLIRKVRK